MNIIANSHGFILSQIAAGTKIKKNSILETKVHCQKLFIKSFTGTNFPKA